MDTNTVYRAAFPLPAFGMGCREVDHDDNPDTPDQPVCKGYELDVDLDFTVPADYAGGVLNTAWTDDPDDPTDTGWTPIGTAANPFTAEFRGQRQHHQQPVRQPGEHRRGRAVRADGRGRGGRQPGAGEREMSPEGNQTGGLVGNNLGRVTGAYVTGSVGGGQDVGGLAGASAGLVGGSYATASVTGTGNKAGGLVGWNKSGATIAASYATGIVSTGLGQNAGGLAGRNDGEITASWTAGVLGDTGGNAGGVVGSNTSSGEITASYFDSGTSHLLDAHGAGDADGAAGKMSSDLKAGLATSDIFVTWNVDIDGDGAADAPWDFGVSTEYPALKGVADDWESLRLPAPRRAGADGGDHPRRAGCPSPGPRRTRPTARRPPWATGCTATARRWTGATASTPLAIEDIGLENNRSFPYDYQLAAVIDGGTPAWAALAEAKPVPQVTGFTVTPNPVVEANDVTVTVTLDTFAGADIDVAFTYSGGASFGFADAASTVRVEDGDKTGSRVLSPASGADDTTDEPNGVMTFTIGTGEDYTLAPAPGLPRDVTVDIHDDDGPQVRVEVVTPAGDDPAIDEGGTVTFRVVLGSAAVEETSRSTWTDRRDGGLRRDAHRDAGGDHRRRRHGDDLLRIHRHRRRRRRGPRLHHRRGGGLHHRRLPHRHAVQRHGRRSWTTDRNDYDEDDDHLIDVDSLARLNAVRWDLDGDGDPVTANAADYSGAAGAFPWPA